MRRRFIAIVVTLLILVLPCGGWSFDKEAPAGFPFRSLFPEGVEYVDLSASIVQVNTIGQATGRYWQWTDYYAGKGEWRWGQGAFIMKAVGWVMEDPDNSQARYIVTAGHVVHPELVTISIGQSHRMITLVEEILWSRTMVSNDGMDAAVPARIVYFNNEYDMAILQVRNQLDIFKPIGFPVTRTYGRFEFGWFDEVFEGDVVAIICRRRNPSGDWSPWFEVRWGKVVANYGVGPNERLARWLNLEDITLNLEIHPGDSGSPLFAFWKGKPVIIGIIRAMDIEGNTYAVRIDRAVPVLRGAVHPWFLK